MANSKVTFDTAGFIANNGDLGDIQKQGNSVLFIKTQNWGKIEFNYKSCRIIVGSGASAKMHEAIVTAIFDKLSLQLAKRNKSYTVFEAPSHADFRRVFGVVTSIAPMAKAKADKVAKPKAERKTQADNLTKVAAARIKAIKAKNLEVIKSVAAKRAANLVG